MVNIEPGAVPQRVTLLPPWYVALWQGKRELWTVGVLLLLVLCAFFSKALLPGRVLSDASLLYQTVLYNDQTAPAVAQPGNSLLFDQVFQFEPWRNYAFAALRHGHWPLWNPYSACGSSLIATYQSGVFSPIHWLLLIFPTPYSYVAGAILRLWIAGFFTYLLLRRYHVGSTGAFVSALSFMLCGFLIVWLGHPQTNVVIWLPALILLTEQLLQADTPRLRIRTTAWLALVIGVQFLGGHLESSVDIVTTTMVYFVGRWLQIHKSQTAPYTAWGWAALALGLGTLVSAVQILPFLEWLPLSTVLAKRSATQFHLLTLGALKPFALNLVVLLYPDVYSQPWIPSASTDFLVTGHWAGTNYNEWALYVGVIALFFAMIAVLRRLKTPFVLLWSIIALVALGRAMSLPVFDWLNHMPILKLEASGRLRLVAMFSLCVLAGQGYEAVIEEWNQPWWQALWKGFFGFIVFCGISLACFYEVLHRYIAQRISPPTHDWQRALISWLGVLNPRSVYLYVPLFVAIGCLLALRFLRHHRNGKELFSAAVIALIMLDLFGFGMAFNPAMPLSKFYPFPTVGSALNANPGLWRISALYKTSLPDTQMVYRWSDIRSMDFPTRWYSQYIALSNAEDDINTYSIMEDSVRSPLLRVLNLKCILAQYRYEMSNDPNITGIRKIGNVFVGEEKSVQPRSFLVTQSVNTVSDGTAAHLLSQNPDAVFHRVVLSSQNAPSLPVYDEQAVGNLQVTHYTAEESDWNVQALHPSYLVTTDSYYPGWKAILDGHPVPIYRANLAFRAVYIPAGNHTLSYRYQPRSVRDGAVLSLLAFLGIVVLFVVGVRPSRQAMSAENVPSSC